MFTSTSEKAIEKALERGWKLTTLGVRKILLPPENHVYNDASHACYYIGIQYKGETIMIPHYFYQEEW